MFISLEGKINLISVSFVLLSYWPNTTGTPVHDMWRFKIITCIVIISKFKIGCSDYTQMNKRKIPDGEWALAIKTLQQLVQSGYSR